MSINQDQSVSQYPPPETRNLRVGDITPDIIKSLDLPFRPGPHEIQGMIQSICHRKQWSRPFLAALMSVSTEDLRRWEIGQGHKPPGVVVKFLWFIYTLDTAPALCFSILHCATYGKCEAKPASIKHRIVGEDRQKIIEELKAHIPGKKKYTRQTLAEKLGCSTMTATRIAQEAGYRLGNGMLKRYRKKQIPMILRPGSIYMALDWRKKVRELAQQARVTEQTIKIVKAKLRKIPRQALALHLGNLGFTKQDRKRFAPIFKEAVYRGKKNNTRTLDTGIISNEALAADEEKSTQESLGTQEETNPRGEVQLQCEQGERQISEQAQTQEGSHCEDGERGT